MVPRCHWHFAHVTEDPSSDIPARRGAPAIILPYREAYRGSTRYCRFLLILAYYCEERSRDTGRLSLLIGEDVAGRGKGPLETAEELEKVVKDFISKARGNMRDLTGVSENDIERIRSIEFLKGVMKGIVIKQADAASLKYADKSVYDLKIEGLYGDHALGYEAEKARAAVYLKGIAKDDAKKRRFMVTAVENAFDLKMLSESIRERRQAMGVKSAEEDPVRDFVILRLTWSISRGMVLKTAAAMAFSLADSCEVWLKAFSSVVYDADPIRTAVDDSNAFSSTLASP